MAENQPTRINGAEILSLRNWENVEIVIVHPTCGIDHCGKESCGNRYLQSRILQVVETRVAEEKYVGNKVYRRLFSHPASRKL